MRMKWIGKWSTRDPVHIAGSNQQKTAWHVVWLSIQNWAAQRTRQLQNKEADTKKQFRAQFPCPVFAISQGKYALLNKMSAWEGDLIIYSSVELCVEILAYPMVTFVTMQLYLCKIA